MGPAARHRRSSGWIPTIALCLLVPVAVRAQAGGGVEPPVPTQQAVAASPDVEVSCLASLEGLLADWPALVRLKGSARVRVQAVAAPRGTHRLVQVRSEDAHVGELALGRLDIWVWTPALAPVAEVMVAVTGPLGGAEARLQADVRLDPKAGRLVFGPGPLTGWLEVRRLDLSLLTKAWPILALGGTLDAVASLQGLPESPGIEVRLEGQDVGFRGERIGGFLAEWRHGDGDELRVRLGEVDAPLALARVEVPIALDLRAGTLRWLDGDEHALEVTATGLTPDRLRPLWRAPAAADFLLDLTIRGKGTLDRFDLQALLSGQLRTKGVEPVPVELRLEVGSERQSLAFALGDKLARLALATRIPLVAVRRQGAPLAPVPVEGSLDLALPLAVVAPFLPDALDRPAGLVAGHIDASGTLGTPVLKGRVESRDARATLIPLNRRLDPLSLVASIDGPRLTLDALDATSAPGTIRARGEGRLLFTPPGQGAGDGLWSAWSLTADATAEMTDFPVVQTELPVSTVRGTLAARIAAGPGQTAVVLTLSRFEGEFTPEKLPKARTVPSNPAVRVLDWLQRDVTGDSLLAGAGHLSLELVLQDPLRFRGEGVDLAVEGRMLLDRLGPVVRVDGGLKVQPGGRFRLFGNRFEVREGLLTLAEGRLDRPASAGPVSPSGGGGLADPDRPPIAAPLEPMAEVVARGKAVGTHVLVRVLGPVRRPELVLASSPPLPEYQILTLLIMGRADAVDDRNGEVRREASRLVDRFHNPSLKRQLFDRLGVDKVGLGFGKSVKQPILTVGKQLTRTLYVESLYHHNAPPGTNQVQGHVEYRVDPRWTLDTVFGDRGEGGFGVFWTTTFGSPAPPSPPGDDWGLIAARARGDLDGDGLEDPFDLCPGQVEDVEGYRDEDGCPDGGDPDQRPPAVEPGRLQVVEGAVRTLRFARDRTDLDRDGLAVLKTAALFLKDLPEAFVEVTGHSDLLGTSEANLSLSRLRAAGIRDALVAAGFASRRISVVGRGDSAPLDPGVSDEAGQQNRRAEVRILPGPPGVR